MLRSVAKHSPELAQYVVEAGALECLVECLEDFDGAVKESAAWALGYIATHTEGAHTTTITTTPTASLLNSHIVAATAMALLEHHTLHSDLAGAVVDAGAVPLLVMCVQEPEITLKRVCASALSDISKHSQEVNQA